jgi:hypothetical protein
LRRLRIAAPAQLTLDIPGLLTTPVERWWSLPPDAQEAVVCVLARMIADGVIEEAAEEGVVDDVHR